MKKILLAIISIMAVLALTGTTSYGKGDGIDGHYKNNGQLRFVNNSNKCNPSEYPITWPNLFPPPGKIAQKLYVNEATGHDLPGWGLTEKRPFKTISHAIDSVSFLRPNAESHIAIYIAAGMYYETIRIDKDNISLEGEGGDITIIDGQNSGSNVIDMINVKKMAVRNLTVRNGAYGICARQGSMVILEGIMAMGNSADGLRITENSVAWFKNCTAQNNGDTGIFILFNSSATLSGSIVSDNNTGNGIYLFSSSALISFPSTSILTNHNNYGFIVMDTSNTVINGSSMEIINNIQDGFHVNGNSKFSLVNGSKVISSNNNARGAEIVNASSLGVSNNSSVEAKDNLDSGIGLYDSSSLSLNAGSTIQCMENMDGMSVSRAAIWVSGDSSITLTNNRNSGLAITNGTSAGIQGAITINTNGMFGLFSWVSSSITLEGTTHIEGNGYHGTPGIAAIFVGRTSHAALNGNIKIINNASLGVLVREGSGVDFGWGNVLIEGNGMDGISVSGNSHVETKTPNNSLDLKIIDNRGCGVSINQNSSAFFRTGTLIEDNDNEGLWVWGNSQVQMNDTIIQNNGTATGKNGVHIDDSSVGINNSTITGNGGNDISAFFGARLTLYGNTIGAMSCDGTVLSRGDSVCP